MNQQITFTDFNAVKNGITITAQKGEPESDSLVFYLSGYLDNKNSKDFMEQISGILSILHRYDSIIFDLKELTYLSSTGVGVLHSLLLDMNEGGTKLVLCNLNKKIKSVLQLLGLYSYFNIQDCIY
jgi:anti-anti-sigma factor